MLGDEDRSGVVDRIDIGDLDGGGAVFERDSHPVLVYLASLAPGSRRTMRASLNSIAGFVSGGEHDAMSLAWHRMEYRHTTAVRAALAEAYAPSTANKMLSAMKGVIRECFRLNYISAEQLARVCDVASIRGEREQKGRSLSRNELGSLLQSCAQDERRTRGFRDHAIISIMYSLGLRRSEVVHLNTEDYIAEEQVLRIRAAKGNKDRSSPLNSNLMDSMDRWLSVRGYSSKDDDFGPLFLPILKSGAASRKRMTDQGVLYILQRRAREAGIRSFTPHDLRRTFIGDLLDAGADISTVQQLAGHSNVQTTTRYDRRGDEAKRRAVSLIDLPSEPEREE